MRGEQHIKASTNYFNKSSDSALDDAARKVNSSLSHVKATNLSSKVVSTVFNQPTAHLSMTGGIDQNENMKIDPN